MQMLLLLLLLKCRHFLLQVPDIPSVLAHLRLMPESEIRRKLAEMQWHRWRFVFKVSGMRPCLAAVTNMLNTAGGIMGVRHLQRSASLLYLSWHSSNDDSWTMTSREAMRFMPTDTGSICRIASHLHQMLLTASSRAYVQRSLPLEAVAWRHHCPACQAD